MRTTIEILTNVVLTRFFLFGLRGAAVASPSGVVTARSLTLSPEGSDASEWLPPTAVEGDAEPLSPTAISAPPSTSLVGFG